MPQKYEFYFLMERKISHMFAVSKLSIIDDGQADVRDSLVLKNFQYGSTQGCTVPSFAERRV